MAKKPMPPKNKQGSKPMPFAPKGKTPMKKSGKKGC